MTDEAMAITDTVARTLGTAITPRPTYTRGRLPIVQDARPGAGGEPSVPIMWGNMAIDVYSVEEADAIAAAFAEAAAKLRAAVEHAQSAAAS